MSLKDIFSPGSGSESKGNSKNQTKDDSSGSGNNIEFKQGNNSNAGTKSNSESKSNSGSNAKSKSGSSTKSRSNSSGSSSRSKNSSSSGTSTKSRNSSSGSGKKTGSGTTESKSGSKSSSQSKSGNKSTSKNESKSSTENQSQSSKNGNESKSNTGNNSQSNEKSNQNESKSSKKSSNESSRQSDENGRDESSSDSSENRQDRESVRRSRNIELENFVVTDEVEKIVARSKHYLNAGYPVHFTGPAGVGKTSLALYLASLYDQPVVFLQGNHEMANVDLIGGTSGYKATKNVDNFVRTVYKHTEELNEKRSEGLLAKAVKNGYTVVYDEFTRSLPETNNLLLSVIEEGILPLYGTKQDEAFIRVHPDFKIIFTSNPVEYAGVYQSQDALRDRLITLELSRGSSETEVYMIQERTGIKKEEAETIIELVESIRNFCEKEEVQGPSFRASIMIGDIARHNDIPIDSSDEDFVTLCKDILSDAVNRCMKEEKNDTEAKDKIAKELKKI
ncbi:gas vesicle protein GvpN [Alteribacter natronophilus]|uniref:gas vesicle protein GvpN n=1 Tax=Alteribacter natronophilus TaxID=2583810 RepID=UPI00110F68FC|nr:gas vesicle protein GvpN [Alteribacter natronophilus]TMW72216.1 gas vesicle protein GvpN [Alteribacter natronophilus]